MRNTKDFKSLEYKASSCLFITYSFCLLEIKIHKNVGTDYN